MKAIYAYISVMLAAFALGGCDVHEFPDIPDEPQPEHKCTLQLKFDNDDFDWLATIGSETRGSVSHTDRDLRVIVRLYPLTPGDGIGSAHVSTRDGIEIYSTTYPDDGTHPDVEIPLDAGPGEYQVVAWADHVETGKCDDLYYTTGDFLEIRLPNSGESDYEHKGNDRYSVAWRGSTAIIIDDDGSVSLSSRAAEHVTEISVEMTRPLARYHFITNDLRKFIDSESARIAPEGIPSVKTFEPDDYRVVVRYTGYMSCAFNALTDKPVDSATGVIYDGRIRVVDGDRAEVAFDHLLVNHAETSVQVALELYRRSDGARLSSTGVIDVPLRRGHYTLVEGALLTTDAGASTGISPDFNGDYNIEIK